MIVGFGIVKPRDDENEPKTQETAEAQQTERQSDDDLLGIILKNMPDEMRDALKKPIVDAAPEEDKQVFTAPDKALEICDLVKEMMCMISDAEAIEKKRMLANLAHNTMNYVLAYMKAGIADMKRLSGEEAKPRA